MKYLFIMFVLSSCYYDDICPKDRQLQIINKQLAIEGQIMTNLLKQPMTDDNVSSIIDEDAKIEELLIDKAFIEQSSCK